MSEPGNEGEHAEHGDDGADRTASTVTTAGPRDALHRGNDSRREHQPNHRRKYAVYAGIAACIVAVTAAASAHAAEGEPTGQLTLFAAIVLGVIQGITEFLPISSDGHLALGSALLGLEGGAGGHRFTITVHAGTLLAVIWTYRTDLIALAKAALKPTAASNDRHLLLAMLVASLPLGFAVMPGVKDAIIAMEAETRWVGVWLWVSALALWLGFRHERRNPPSAPGTLPTLRQALIIGLAQVTAILPGLSRSGMTISTALLVGLDRAVAARFSFLISVIAVSGAVAKEVLDLATAPADPTPIDLVPYAAGFAVSLVVGLVALRGLLLIVGRGRVMGFVVYLAILGGVAIALG